MSEQGRVFRLQELQRRFPAGTMITQKGRRPDEWWTVDCVDVRNGKIMALCSPHGDTMRHHWFDAQKIIRCEIAELQR